MKIKNLVFHITLIASQGVVIAAEKNKELKVTNQTEDKYIWLEEILSEKSMSWVKAENKKTIEYFTKQKKFDEYEKMSLEISGRTDKIKYARLFDDIATNIWTDTDNPRGLIRRSARADYLAGKQNWETVLDIGALGKKENISWVYKGFNELNNKVERILLFLSPGGQDSVVIREFDFKNKNFVENGFNIPESKSGALYFDKDTILLSDATTESSKTKIGYPRTVRMVKRGEEISKSKILFEAKKDDLSARAFSLDSAYGQEFFVSHALDFYKSTTYWLNPKDITLHKLPIPEENDISKSLWGDYVLIQNQKQWKTKSFDVPSGSVVGFNLKKFKENRTEEFVVIYSATKDFMVQSVIATKNYLYMSGTKDIISQVRILELSKDNKIEQSQLDLPGIGTANIFSSHFLDDLLLLPFDGFTTSPVLFLVNKKNNLQKLQEQPTKWDSSNVESLQYWTKSKDGTPIPYFVIKQKQAKLDGKNPTILYGYGGFNISMLPGYSEYRGRAWIDDGGIFVLSNIRGGGEFGPDWHKAAILENKQRSYDDFIAIAEDLIARKITSPKHLGIMGGSNGGLLMGVMLTQRPDLFSAITCQVPLLDMMRYTLMKNAKGDVVGQSWAAEYGDPIKDSKMASIIAKYSPYQKLTKEQKYPSILFTTSTRDDRVVPSHARKMAAKLSDLEHKYWYYENIEGGHGGAADFKQTAFSTALTYSYFLHELTDNK